jgi:hypothetical protein
VLTFDVLNLTAPTDIKITMYVQGRVLESVYVTVAAIGRVEKDITRLTDSSRRLRQVVVKDKAITFGLEAVRSGVSVLISKDTSLSVRYSTPATTKQPKSTATNIAVSVLVICLALLIH